VTQFDTTCLFLLQLSCILRMVPGWKRHSALRVFACVPLGTSSEETQVDTFCLYNSNNNNN